MGLPRTKEQRLVHCGVVGHTGKVAPLLLRSCSLFSRELVGLFSPSRTTPCSSALLLVELSVVQSGLLCCAPRSHSPHTTFHFYSRSFIASVASYANVESGKHRKKCESVLGHKKQSFGPLNFHFSPQVPQFHSFSRKNQSESPFQVYFAYGSCKKHIISTIFQHVGTFWDIFGTFWGIKISTCSLVVVPLRGTARLRGLGGAPAHL